MAAERILHVTYVYDRPGWALHNLGLMLQARLAPAGVQVTCVRSDEWHGAPEMTECLYLSYTGLVREHFDYDRWATTLLTTIHDPCEISHFEDRADWRRFPLLALSFDRFDRVSVTSQELAEILPAAYGLPVFRTPTWPTTEIVHETTVNAVSATHSCVVISSTILPKRFTPREVLQRARRLRQFTMGADGRRSWSQLRGLLVLKRRKNVGWLAAIQQRFAGERDIECLFRYGNSGPVSAADWVAQLRRANVYVCTSTMEGGPLPVMEAVQAGLAVVSTPVGQVEEWVHDGVNGRICRSLNECIRALEAYRHTPDLLASHQAASRSLATGQVFPADAWIRFFRGD